mmetsp:Transcript_10455/g.13754  ORF Transcript_10455/g.13754 Transcript_10455/m.13754 type:complete len:230 (-) Transcript_10455:463-1152(-)
MRGFTQEHREWVEHRVQGVAAGSGWMVVRRVEHDVEQQNRQRQAQRRPQEVEETSSLRAVQAELEERVHGHRGQPPQLVEEQELRSDHTVGTRRHRRVVLRIEFHHLVSGLAWHQPRGQLRLGGTVRQEHGVVQVVHFNVALGHCHDPAKPRVPKRRFAPGVRVTRRVTELVVLAVLGRPPHWPVLQAEAGQAPAHNPERPRCFKRAVSKVAVIHGQRHGGQRQPRQKH